MKLPRHIQIAASAALVLTCWLAGRAVLAAEPKWEAMPVSHHEPIGGRIEEAPAESDVTTVSATEPVGSPPARLGAPQRQRPVSPRMAANTHRPPMRMAAMERSGTPWQAAPPGAAPVPGYPQPNRGGSRDMRMAARGRVIEGPVTFAPDGPMPEAVDSGEVIQGDGREIVEGMPGEIIEGDGWDGYGEDCGGCGECDDCCLLSCPKCPPGCIPAPQWPKNIDIIGGVQGFKGPLDQGRNGNFGFHEGFNIGGPLWLAKCVSYQVGGMWDQSNFNGDQSTGQFRDESRHQTFATAGLFIRADSCLPWQGGVVIDWLNDDYTVNYDVSQVRAELSRVGCFGNEFGFMGAFHIREDELDVGNVPGARDGILTLRTTDQYALFLRRHWDNCGEGRIWGGVTGDGDGLVGADYRIPVSDSFLLQGNFNYLIANESGHEGQINDSWGINLELVFMPFCRARRSMTDHNRPLFNVADNARLFVEPK